MTLSRSPVTRRRSRTTRIRSAGSTCSPARRHRSVFLALATIVYYRSGTLALAAMADARETAVFSVAAGIAFGLLMLPNAITTALLPRLSAEADLHGLIACARRALVWTTRRLGARRVCGRRRGPVAAAARLGSEYGDAAAPLACSASGIPAHRGERGDRNLAAQRRARFACSACRSRSRSRSTLSRSSCSCRPSGRSARRWQRSPARPPVSSCSCTSARSALPGLRRCARSVSGDRGPGAASPSARRPWTLRGARARSTSRADMPISRVPMPDGTAETHGDAASPVPAVLRVVQDPEPPVRSHASRRRRVARHAAGSTAPCCARRGGRARPDALAARLEDAPGRARGSSADASPGHGSSRMSLPICRARRPRRRARPARRASSGSSCGRARWTTRCASPRTRRRSSLCSSDMAERPFAPQSPFLDGGAGTQHATPVYAGPRLSGA